jgi:hypothetical protein
MRITSPITYAFTLVSASLLAASPAATAETQTISIKTICVDGNPITSAACTLKVGNSVSQLVTPATANVPKSTEDLSVSCVKGGSSATGLFTSRRAGGTWGKLAAWGGMDQMLNWKDLDQLDYPKEMTVVLVGNCSR